MSKLNENYLWGRVTYGCVEPLLAAIRPSPHCQKQRIMIK